jgi:hypothetical protein
MLNFSAPPKELLSCVLQQYKMVSVRGFSTRLILKMPMTTKKKEKDESKKIYERPKIPVLRISEFCKYSNCNFEESAIPAIVNRAANSKIKKKRWSLYFDG